MVCPSFRTKTLGQMGIIVVQERNQEKGGKDQPGNQKTRRKWGRLGIGLIVVEITRGKGLENQSHAKKMSNFAEDTGKSNRTVQKKTKGRVSLKNQPEGHKGAKALHRPPMKLMIFQKGNASKGEELEQIPCLKKK